MASIESEVTSVVAGLPSELAFRHVDVAQRLGEKHMESLDALRRRILRGVVWTQDDLEDALVGSGGAARREDVRAALAIIRGGAVMPVDLKNLSTRRTSVTTRASIGMAWTAVLHPWLPYAVSVLVAATLGALVGGRLDRRFRWAAYSVSAAGLVCALALVGIDWPTPSDVIELLPIDRSYWPQLSATLHDGPLPRELARLGRELRRDAAVTLACSCVVGPAVHLLTRLAITPMAGPAPPPRPPDHELP